MYQYLFASMVTLEDLTIKGWVHCKCLLMTTHNGPHFLCWISVVVPFNMWLISNSEDNNCCTSWATHRMTTLTILSEVDVILCICSTCNNNYVLLSSKLCNQVSSLSLSRRKTLTQEKIKIGWVLWCIKVQICKQ